MFFVAAASAAAIDDADKKQDKRGVLGVGYPGYVAPAVAAPIGLHHGIGHAPLLAHAPIGNRNFPLLWRFFVSFGNFHCK